MTDLTVIIPTFNRKESLFRLLDALRSQQQVTLEIIIIDQNSSSHFSEDEHHKLHHVRHILQETPNVSAARNTGAALALSDHVLFVDDDLVPEPNFCHELLSVIRKYPMVRAFAPLVFSYEDKSLLKVQYSKRYLKNKLYKELYTTN